MSDTPELTPLARRVEVALEWKRRNSHKPVRELIDALVRDVAELEQAVKDRDEWIDELHACLFQPGPVGLHTLLLVAQGIARAAVDARQGENDG